MVRSSTKIWDYVTLGAIAVYGLFLISVILFHFDVDIFSIFGSVIGAGIAGLVAVGIFIAQLNEQKEKDEALYIKSVELINSISIELKKKSEMIATYVFHIEDIMSGTSVLNEDNFVDRWNSLVKKGFQRDPFMVSMSEHCPPKIFGYYSHTIGAMDYILDHLNVIAIHALSEGGEELERAKGMAILLVRAAREFNNLIADTIGVELDSLDDEDIKAELNAKSVLN